MKKILSIILILVSVIAFSGLATADSVSAYSIKDRGSWSKEYTDIGVEYTHLTVVKWIDWYLKYYDKNHCKFYLTNYKNYPPENTYGHTFDYKRISKTKIKVTVKAYYKIYTTGTTSYIQKQPKHHINYQIQKILLYPKIWRIRTGYY